MSLNDVQSCSPEEAEELRCVERARGGQEDAWRELHRRYYKGLWSTVNQLVHDEALAEDIVQDSFLKAYRKIGSFKGDARFSTWIYRIAVNQSYDVMRRMNRRQKWLGLFPLQEEEEGPEHQAVDEHTGARSADLADQREALRRALDTLAPEQRAVVELRLIQGFSTEETARILKCKRGTVLSRLFYSCQKLRKVLEREYHEV